jgi:hypothetical protein
MIRPYDQAAKEFSAHLLRTTEVPVEYYVSDALPTRRWARPAYAGFAGPASGVPPQPPKLGTPNRWWAIGAEDGRLLAYALVSVIPFAQSLPEGPVTVQDTGRSISEALEDRRLFGELMTAAVPAFFSGESGASTVRGDLAEVAGQVLTPELMPWYRALAADFFEWLER